MAGIFIDGFGYYATSGITRKWSSIIGGPVIQSTVIADGPNALNCSDNDQVLLDTADITSWVFGFRFRIDGFARRIRILSINDSDTVDFQCSLNVNTNATLEVSRGASTAVLGGESVLTLNSNIWYHIEMIVTLSDSIPAGSCEVRVNEVSFLTVDTGEDLTEGPSTIANRIVIGSHDPISTQELYFESVYILDGATHTFLGDSRIAQMFPNANGTTNEFTGSDGNSVNNFEHVRETVTDDDTTFNESDGVGDIDLYNLQPMPTADTIHMVQVNAVVRKDDAGSRTMRIVTRPASTNFFSPSISPSSGSYSNARILYDESPETSSAWTKAELDVTQAGPEIET